MRLVWQAAGAPPAAPALLGVTVLTYVPPCHPLRLQLLAHPLTRARMKVAAAAVELLSLPFFAVQPAPAAAAAPGGDAMMDAAPGSADEEALCRACSGFFYTTLCVLLPTVVSVACWRLPLRDLALEAEQAAQQAVRAAVWRHAAAACAVAQGGGNRALRRVLGGDSVAGGRPAVVWFLLAALQTGGVRACLTQCCMMTSTAHAAHTAHTAHTVVAASLFPTRFVHNMHASPATVSLRSIHVHNTHARPLCYATLSTCSSARVLAMMLCPSQTTRAALPCNPAVQPKPCNLAVHPASHSPLSSPFFLDSVCPELQTLRATLLPTTTCFAFVPDLRFSISLPLPLCVRATICPKA